MLSTTLILIIMAAVIFDMSNGFHDAANAIATVITTRVLSPRKAILMAAILNFAGAFVSTTVATTIGKGMIDPNPKVIAPFVVLAALLSAIVWNIITTVRGLPCSSSHALIGGLIGAAVYHAGISCLLPNGLIKVGSSLLLSPFFGFVCGFALMLSLIWIFRKYAPSTLTDYFKRLQLFSAALMSFSHGSNDAQKAMGIITLALVAGGYQTDFVVHWWVVLICASSMALGTAFGGWEVIKTMGSKILKLKPIHGFAAETASSIVILTASMIGAPVSTTHVTSASIMGVGSTIRFSAVRWGIVTKIVLAWVLTLPVCALGGYLLAPLCQLIAR
jgi:inorganic phosphate transporter, PiT family